MMSETQNTPQKNAEQAERSPAPQSTMKKLWGYLNAFLDYVDEEVPDSPQKADAEASPSKLKKAWTWFNAFLDSLEAHASELPEKSPGNPLKKAGGFCWEIVFHCAIVVFLFGLAAFTAIKALDFVNARHVSFSPSREVMQYLVAEHESLEAAADSLPAGKDRSDNIPPALFGEQCAATLKPLRIYSDEYGFYLVTSQSEYVGENGIFIARDAERMPEDLSWWLVKGRVFAYAFFK